MVILLTLVIMVENGHWGGVCDSCRSDCIGDYKRMAKVVCKMLGYPSDEGAFTATAVPGYNHDSFILDDVNIQIFCLAHQVPKNFQLFCS